MTNEPQPHRRRRTWIHLGASVAALLIVAGLALGMQMIAAARQDPPPDRPNTLVVRTEPIARSDAFRVPRTYIGKIEARRRSRVGFELSGRLIDLTADDGDLVEAGAVIARLDTARLEARIDQLEAARAEAAARAELAAITYARVKRVFERNAAVEQELDEAQQELAARRAALQTIDEDIERIRVDLAKSILRAPFDAVVARRSADEGTVVAPGEPVFELLERDRPEARIGVTSPAARSLAAGDAVTVRVHDEAIAGGITAILPVTERGTRTIEVVITLEARLDGLRSGDLAAFDIERRVEASGVWLPLPALTESRRGLWACFVAVPHDAASDAPGTHRIERRELELLYERGPDAYVNGPLKEGERVVTSGIHRLTAGQAVRLERSGSGS